MHGRPQLDPPNSPVSQITSGGVDKDSLSVRADTVALVDVSVDVVLWPHSFLHGVEQVHASGADPRGAEVAVPDRRRVGDEHVGVVGDQVPLVQEGAPASQVEPPTAKLRLPRGAVKLCVKTQQVIFCAISYFIFLVKKY